MNQSISWNINQILKSRELLPTKRKIEIENALEESFLAGNYLRSDVELPSNVSSTIAIAVSCDGKTFASTHGDHTVKIFYYYSNEPYRIFAGHPRTPWTVKYHPSDPNIVASGCLGSQVRVWSIETNSCLSVNRLDYSIISLSFHPSGDFLAIASGATLEVWNWNRAPSQTNRNHIVHCHPVAHNRNIRAVLFYPSGEYILAAAPESPRMNQDSLTYCNIFAIPFRDIQVQEGNGPMDPINLLSFRAILRQIHLYSDGGFDISKGGQNYLVTCARLREKSNNRLVLSKKTSFSPLSTSDRVAEEERNSSSSLPPPPSSAPFVSSMPFFPQANSLLGAPLEYRRGSKEVPASFGNFLRETIQLVEPPDSKNVNGRANSSSDRRKQQLQPERSSASFTFNQFLSPQKVIEPGKGMQFDQSSKDDEMDCAEDGDVVRRVHSLESYFAFKSTISSSAVVSRRPYENPELSVTISEDPFLPGVKFEDHLCVFKIDFDPATNTLKPVLLNAKLLSGNLMKAITSTKISPTSRVMMVGYGVRSEQGIVQDHIHPNVSCELISLTDPTMKSELIITDEYDEVNIAQFHTVAGHGILYGTKRGKIKTFTRETR